MKKFLYILLSAALLCGCSADPMQEETETSAVTAAASAETEAPAPFVSADLNDNFYLPGDRVVNNIPAELLSLRDEDKVTAWLEGFPDISETAPDSLSGYANTFLFIREFEVTRSEAETALEYYLSSEDEQLRITAGQLDVLLSGDETAAAQAFANPYTIVKGGKMYCPNWLYTHSAEDYEAAGLTPEEISQKFPEYGKLGMDADAEAAFKKKLNDYGASFSLIESEETSKNANVTELPEPFSNEVYEAPEGFFDTVDMKLGYIDMSFVDLVGTDVFEEWLNSASSSTSDLTGVAELANLYSFIKHFDIPADTVRETLSDIRTGDESADFTDEEIDLILSEDDQAVAEHFASEYAVQKGENLYSVKWLYYHDTEDYRAAGITAGDIKEKMPLYWWRLNLSESAKEVLLEKLFRYITDNTNITENSSEEELLTYGKYAGMYYSYAAKKYFSWGAYYQSCWYCGGNFNENGYKCLGMYTDNSRSKILPMDYSTAREYMIADARLTERGFDELCENSPTRYLEKNRIFYIKSEDGGGAGWSGSVVADCERDGDTITYNCEHIGFAEDWGYEEDLVEPFTFRLKLEDGVWKLDGCSDALALFDMYIPEYAEARPD